MSQKIGWYSLHGSGKTCIDFLIAILSVYDKTGLVEFAQELHALNVRLLGSGGTAKLIRNAGIPIG